MQNNSNNPQIPPHLMQQYQQQQRMYLPQAAYPMMSNLRPSERTHGVFSSYSARLKGSDDNALLLPESFVTKRTRFTGDESEDEFDEDSEEENEETEQEETQQEKESVPEDIAASLVVQPSNLPKVIRKKNDLAYTSVELENISKISEVLVPIRLDIDIDTVKLRDRFLWNMNGKKVFYKEARVG